MSPSNGRRLLVWDLDGTLVDSQHDLAGAANAVRLHFGWPEKPLPEVMAAVGHGLHHLLSQVCPDLAPSQLPLAITVFEQSYLSCCLDRTRCYPGVEQALADAADLSWRQAVLTNKPVRFAERIIAGLGLRHHFAVVIGGDQVKKPDPAGLLAICDMTRRAPEQTVMIGDHHADVGVAAAAGTASGLCAWGYGHLAEHAPTWTWQQPADIIPALQAAAQPHESSA